MFYNIKIQRSICGQEQKSLLRSPLKLLFCKLCTTLSTQIVDKRLTGFYARGARREPQPQELQCAAEKARRNAMPAQRAARGWYARKPLLSLAENSRRS